MFSLDSYKFNRFEKKLSAPEDTLVLLGYTDIIADPVVSLFSKCLSESFCIPLLCEPLIGTFVCYILFILQCHSKHKFNCAIYSTSLTAVWFLFLLMDPL